MTSPIPTPCRSSTIHTSTQPLRNFAPPARHRQTAQHKAVGISTKALESGGVYVDDVVVTGLVKGTAFASGNAILEAWTIAEKFWRL